MSRKYLAFDIETAAALSDAQFQNWKAHRPLGIACIAAQACDAATPTFWDGRDAGGGHDARLSRAQISDFVAFLERMRSQGYTLLTWNGVGFDWDVVAEESGMIDLCRELAVDHVDPMFHIFCELGYPVSLEKAAQGRKIQGKPEGMTGFQAPRLWAQGRYQEVLDYVAEDVRIVLEVAVSNEKQRSFRWITAKGDAKSMPLPGGWLTVQAAQTLPQPDTSWMSSPIPRTRFTQWLDNA